MTLCARSVSLCAGIGLACAAGTALAQSGDPGLERFERRLEQIRREETTRVTEARPADPRPLGGRMLVDYGGYLAFNLLSVDDSEDHNHVLRQYDAIVYGRLNIDQAHEFFVRARASYEDFHRGDSFDGDDEDFDAELERAYYRLDLKRERAAGAGASDLEESLGDGFSVQIGRQLGFWGNGLAMSAVFDGVSGNVQHGLLEVEALAGVTAQYTIDFDTSRPDFNEDTERGLYGAAVTLNWPRFQPFAYVLVQRDYNDDDTLPVQGRVARFEYDSEYFAIGATGAIGDRVAYAAELVYEMGRGMSSGVTGQDDGGEQTREDIEAFAADLRLDYLFPGEWNARLSGELILATGDPDRAHTSNTLGGNRAGTDDRAYNALGLVNTSLAFAPAVSNLLAVRAGASASPGQTGLRPPSLQFGFDFFVFNKFDSDAPIDEETVEGEGFLGVEPDLFVNWQVVEDVTVAVRYGVFFPGDAFEQSDPRHFVFLGLTYAF